MLYGRCHTNFFYPHLEQVSIYLSFQLISAGLPSLTQSWHLYLSFEYFRFKGLLLILKGCIRHLQYCRGCQTYWFLNFCQSFVCRLHASLWLPSPFCSCSSFSSLYWERFPCTLSIFDCEALIESSAEGDRPPCW